MGEAAQVQDLAGVRPGPRVEEGLRGVGGICSPDTGEPLENDVLAVRSGGRPVEGLGLVTIRTRRAPVRDTRGTSRRPYAGRRPRRHRRPASGRGSLPPARPSTTRLDGLHDRPRRRATRRRPVRSVRPARVGVRPVRGPAGRQPTRRRSSTRRRPARTTRRTGSRRQLGTDSRASWRPASSNAAALMTDVPMSTPR